MAAYIFSSTKDIKTLVLKTSVLCFAAIFGYIMLFEKQLFNIVFVEKIGTVSEAARMDTIIFGFEAWKLRPFFGHGSNYVDIMQNLQGTKLSITNTTVVNFVAYGTFFGLYYLINLKQFIDSLESNIVSRMLLYISVLLLFSGSTLIYSPIVAILMFLRIKKEGELEYEFGRRKH